MTGKATFLQGDALARLAKLPSDSVHCCVTSPPYFRLRDYGVAGQYGWEKTPDEFVANLVEVFREVRRVLRADGTCWVNLGDSYRTDGRKDSGDGFRPRPGEIKHKDLVGIPWLVALALRNDGWWLRSDVIWGKTNCLPESVRDRPTRSHEYLFLLSKRATYFYDYDAVKEPCVSGPSDIRNMREGRERTNPKRVNKIGRRRAVGDPSGRNRRSVWFLSTTSSACDHPAMMPEKLAEPCILAGTSAKGACPRCGSPWKRIVKRPGTGPRRSKRKDPENRLRMLEGGEKWGQWKAAHPDIDLGFAPGCACGVATTVPCVVLDPFSGAGTTALVATRAGRNFIGVELNPDYIAQARERLGMKVMAAAGGRQRA